MNVVWFMVGCAVGTGVTILFIELQISIANKVADNIVNAYRPSGSI